MPTLVRLAVSNYGLFLGESSGREATVEFDLSSKMTIVLGANGLGKSTLIQLLYRLLSGPYDIPGAESDSLGSSSLVVKPLSSARRSYFAERVSDGAKSAHATLTFKLGSDSEFSITRELRRMNLVGAKVNERELGRELDLQESLVEAAAIGSYSDWILLLRYVVFFQENRRALIWDEAAQRQILRPLFLPPEVANQWAALERKILELDSETRNFRAVLGKLGGDEEMRVARSRVSKYLKELDRLKSEIVVLEQELNEDSAALDHAQEARDLAREAWLAGEDGLESTRSEYEQAKLAYIGSKLPDRSATAAYLLTLFASENACVSCGQDATLLRAELAQRLVEHRCPACGLNLPPGDQKPAKNIASTRVEKLATRLAKARELISSLQSSASEADREYEAMRDKTRSTRESLFALEERARETRSQLPENEIPDDEDLTSLRQRLSRGIASLEEARSEYRTFSGGVTNTILARATELEAAFIQYAGAFLIEESALVWEPTMTRIGQSGPRFPLPHFSLRMTGNDFPQATARNSADSVSESQREFIDLSFRMALIAVASEAAAGSLIVDSPDSSLDAVFEKKAAIVLNEYATAHTESRLFFTANLSTGDFIPEIVGLFRTATGNDPVLVDLLDVSTPTAALKSLREQYDDARDRVLLEAGLREGEKWQE